MRLFVQKLQHHKCTIAGSVRWTSCTSNRCNSKQLKQQDRRKHSFVILICRACSATEAAAAQKEAEEAHEQYDRSKGQLRILEEEQLRAEEAREQVEQSLQALAAKEAEMVTLQT